ncbi:MAG TPA: NADH-quinone oxidoreductase subunit J [Pirellulales bacterium]
MNPIQWTVAIATLLVALAMWLMLPRASAGFAGRAIGAVFGIVALGLFASLCVRIGGWPTQVLFWILAGVTLIAAGAAVTLRSPVYCAVWFALSLLGTAGLFLFQGAQFLAAATIIVYAGAILVTFLFVLMLAQSTGRAYYDRVCWEPLVSAVTGAVLVGILTMALVNIDFKSTPIPDDAALRQNILSLDHVAHLGQELFSRYLVAVEVAGTLLLAALVGTIAMVGHERPPTEEDRRREQKRQSPRESSGNGRGSRPHGADHKEPVHG